MSPEKENELRKTCITLYALYVISAILQFSELTLLPGLVMLIGAYIWGNSKQKLSKDTVYASHIRWLYRTFWIGSGVIVPLAVLIATLLIIAFTDIISVINTLDTGDPDSTIASITNYMHTNMMKITLITMVSMVPTVLWWIRRCWVGYKLASDGKAVDNVTSWL
jgi:uncharacterized membrane protein